MLKVLIVIQASGLLLLAAGQANVTSPSSPPPPPLAPSSQASNPQEPTTTTLAPPLPENQVFEQETRPPRGANGTEPPAPLVSPSEQNSYFYTGADVAQQDQGPDLSFSLMNAPHERLQAVQHLMDAGQQQQSNLMYHNQHQRLPVHQQSDSQTTRAGQQQQQPPSLPPSQGLVCAHKGRQYLDGQVVAIEEQPCLNCTCRRAILQCYLRVCPPVVSHEAQRRLQAAGENGAPRCRMAKAANQCCPSLRCEPEPTNSTSATRPMIDRADLVDQRSLYQVLTSGQQPVNNRSVEEVMVASASGQQASSTAPPPPQEPSPSDTSHLPKLTVINGAAGQRDSILLITSNPHGSHQHQHHAQSSKRPEVVAAGHALAVPSSTKSDFSTALMEALLETVYSQGAQLSTGLNLEGSCMINGSLYVEGSAVIPEGNALCQYCYCIRQKIMCVRPKCQLIISGCSPRYSNEYACCPTSYTCQSYSSLDQTPLSLRSGASLNPARLTDATSVQSLSAKLWAAIESIQKMQLGSTSTTTTEASTATSSPTKPMFTTSSEEPKLATTEATTTTTSSGVEVDLQLSPRDASGGVVNENITTTTTTTSTSTARPSESSTQSSSDFGPTSVQDFLEPMTKLGPLVMSPQQPSGCLENGRTYAIGEQIPTLESCKHCYCGLDGLKECKMVECQLKGAHDCRPITPEGHCCPIRYECPSAQPASRYRSETGGEEPFADMHQCSDSEGLGEGCQRSFVNSTTTEATTTTTGATNGQQTVPLLKTTRLVDERSMTTTASPLPTSSSPTVPGEEVSTPDVLNDTTKAALNDEINKFIMQIRQQAMNSTTNSSLIEHHVENIQQGYLQPEGPRSQEAMINNQQARMLAGPQDYHSVQPQPELVVDNQQLPPGLQGIPSIVRADETPTSNWTSSTPVSLAELLLNLTTTTTTTPDPIGNNTNAPDFGAVVIGDASSGGGRDSRSAEAKFAAMNEMLSTHGPSLFAAGGNNLEPAIITTLQALGNGLEGADNSSSAFGQAQSLRSQQEPQAMNHSAAMVVFDDELALNLTSNPRQQPEFFLGPNNSNGSEEPAQTTPSPGGVTTGTPLGLEADRSPETRGWLRSLQGFVHSFGRRLTSTQQQHQAEGSSVPAESAPSNELRHHETSSRSLDEQATARHSTGPNLLSHLFNTVIGGTNSVDDQAQSGLVMRPLNEHNNNNDNRLVMSPMEQPVEIVTAPIALEPEIFQDGPTRPLLMEDNSRGFAKRSDVLNNNNDGDTMLGVDSASVPQFQSRSISNRVEKQLNNANNINRVNIQRLVLTCHELATNRTYQPNERIPKQDPCKTCTCVLGEELCQTLVCPEKPGDDCSEERRPGECCPNYLCGNNVTQFASGQPNLAQAPNPRVANLLMMRTAPAEVAANSNNLPKNSAMGTLNPNSMINSMNMPAEHRMMPASLGLREGRLPIGQLLRVFPGASGGPSTSKPLQSSAPNQAQQPPRPRQQLPPHPIRTTDLNQLLPPHLRFRPNQLQAPSSFGPNLLSSSTQPNQLIFQTPSIVGPNWRPQHQQDPNRLFGANNNNNQQQHLHHGSNQFMLNQAQQRPGTIQPPMLMHPQTQSLAATRQPLAGFNQPAIGGGDQAWRASSAAATNVGDAAIQQVMPPPSNILLQRMSPISPSAVQFATSTTPPQLPPAHNLPPQMPLIATGAATDQQTSPSRKVTELAGNELTELSKEQRVLFPGPAQSTEVSMPTSTVQPAQRIAQADLINAPHQANTKLPSDLEAMMPATELLRNSPAQDQKPTEAETSSTPTSTPTTTSTTTLAPSSSEPSSLSSEVSTSSLVGTDSDDSSSPSSSTSTSSSSTSIVSGDSSSPESLSEASTAQSGEASEEFDPLGALFRVSECNIYGRIYKVGQPIDELSDACKRCTCTTMGVDCKRNCP